HGPEERLRIRPARVDDFDVAAERLELRGGGAGVLDDTRVHARVAEVGRPGDVEPLDPAVARLSYLEACDGRIKGLNVAWTSDLGYARVDPRVIEHAGAAAAEFESLGCHVEVVNPGWADPEALFGPM